MEIIQSCAGHAIGLCIKWGVCHEVHAMSTSAKVPNKHFLRPDEAARKLDVSRRTVYRWIDEGKIQAIKYPSGTLRIKGDVIIEILATSE